jgi:hypothetical protein
MIVLVFGDGRPPVTYRAVERSLEACYLEATELARLPPDDEAVVKFMIGCSFEGRVPLEPL